MKTNRRDFLKGLFSGTLGAILGRVGVVRAEEKELEPDGEWHHLCFVQDLGSEITFYIDGQESEWDEASCSWVAIDDLPDDVWSFPLDDISPEIRPASLDPAYESEGVRVDGVDVVCGPVEHIGRARCQWEGWRYSVGTSK